MIHISFSRGGLHIQQSVRANSLDLTIRWIYFQKKSRPSNSGNILYTLDKPRPPINMMDLLLNPIDL